MKIIALALAAIVALTATACSPAGGDPQVIRVGLPGSGSGARQSPSGAWGVAQRQGFLEQEFGKDGIKVQFVYLPGNGVALNEALAAKTLDFATYGGLPNIIGLAGGNPAQVLLVGRSTNTFYLGVRPDSPIRIPADLKGRKVTVQKGNLSHHRLVLWLKANGLGEDDVNLVSLAASEGMAAFAAGQVDAVWSGFPVLAMRDKGQVRIVGSTKDSPEADDDVGLAGLMVGKPFEDAHPQLVARTAKVLLRSYHWMAQEENRAELIAMEAQASGYPAAYYDQEFTGPMKARFNPLIDDRVKGGFGQIIEFAYAHDLIRRKPTLDGWFASQYQQAALKELGLEGYWPAEAARTARAEPAAAP